MSQFIQYVNNKINDNYKIIKFLKIMINKGLLPLKYIVPQTEGQIRMTIREVDPHEGIWVHFCTQKNSRKIKNISGEVCCSKLANNDDLYACWRNWRAVVLSGPCVIEYDRDVWSAIDMLGRRYRPTPWVLGGDRTEAWVNPRQCKIECILSNKNVSVWGLTCPDEEYIYNGVEYEDMMCKDKNGNIIWPRDCMEYWDDKYQYE